MVEAKEVKLVMGVGKLAIGLEKRGIAGDSLVQQIGGLEQVCPRPAAKYGQKKVSRPQVKIVGHKIRSRWLFNGGFLASRDFGFKLICDFFCDLALSLKHLSQILIVFLRP